jgi:hypothetical protein
MSADRDLVRARAVFADLEQEIERVERELAGEPVAQPEWWPGAPRPTRDATSEYLVELRSRLEPARQRLKPMEHE